MPYFIAIQYPYHHVSITLSQQKTILCTKTVSKFEAMSLVIPTIQTLLHDHDIVLTDLAALAINNGPGPFNTLRSIIATANALAFAQNIPLISCNGLDLLNKEIDFSPTLALLDAFGQDVYYGFKDNGQQGYDSIENVIALCNEKYADKKVHFIGNGALKHQDTIQKKFVGMAVMHSKILFSSEQTLIDKTYKKYMQQQFEQEIYPLYFTSPVTK